MSFEQNMVFSMFLYFERNISGWICYTSLYNKLLTLLALLLIFLLLLLILLSLFLLPLLILLLPSLLSLYL